VTTVKRNGGDDDRRAAPRTDPDRRAQHDVIYTLARAAEAHDAHTGEHVLRIRAVVELIAERLGIDDAEALGYDAMLHDVGKLMVPVEILQKPGELTADERTTMEAHTHHGETLLADRPTLARAARIARSHHECWDGTGYPDGLRGNAIPLEARLTAVADVLDALAMERAYKSAWSFDDALAKIQSLAGTHLDPEIVGALTSARDGVERIYRSE